MTSSLTPRWPSLGHLLRERASEHPDREFLRFEGRSLSFGDVDLMSNRIAGSFRSRGIGRGDRVAVMVPNGFDFPLIWLALAKLGAILVPVNAGYREADLLHVLNDSGAIAVVAGDEQLAVVDRVLDDTPHITDVFEVPVGGDSGEVTEIDASQKDVLNLQYTSGTTGFPKACTLTHEYWLRLGLLAANELAFGETDVALTAQPFSYMDPQWNTAMCLVAGSALVILPRFSASTFWRSVAESGATFFYVLGTMPVLLDKQEPSRYEREHRVRLVACSGILPARHADYEARWGVPWREAYGMTETGVDLFVPAEDSSTVGTGAIGRPVATKEVRVVDANDAEVPDGEVGEIVVRGEPMMLRYWNHPEETARVIRDGWLHTGDLGFRDERGYFHLTGRLKDMVRRGGENISALEVENVLCQHPAVQAVAVVPVPDEIRGEEVKAYIQLQPEAEADPEELIAFVEERLASFKVPRFVEFVEEFPLTPSHRVAKEVLIASRADQHAGAFDRFTSR